MESLIIPYLRAGVSKGDSVEIYASIASETAYSEGRPSLFVKAVMDRFDKSEASSNSLRGKVFEFAIGESLAKEGALPLYYQTEVAHVPLAQFDWFLYHPERPVSVSCKTSLRERWKQAALEGMALKRVYPQAANYLVAMEEIANIQGKMDSAPGAIDHFINSAESSWDEAIGEIAQTPYAEAEPKNPITRGSVISAHPPVQQQA